MPGLLCCLLASLPAMRAGWRSLASGAHVPTPLRPHGASALRALSRRAISAKAPAVEEKPVEVTNFVRNIIKNDLASGKHASIMTRFPPEPNGYLHIGHAKSICVNFGLASEFGGQTFMRFDDTNPEKEKREYIDAILADVKWLGFDWGERLTHASDYFDKFHEFAILLIKEGKAYVDSLTADEMREYRGTLTEPGKDSPYRTRTVEENLALFQAMTAGEMEDGSAVLRLKIDMSSPNINLRDPAIYRIKRDAEHPQTGRKWKVYPMYDYAHSLNDALEGITHSLCTTEFEAHRPLYDWVVANVPTGCVPRQIEFSRLNLQYTVLSKRKLIQLVREGHVHGWDDPRMPTLVGLRRRGMPPEAIRLFVERTGVSKAENNIDYAVLEDCARASLDAHAPRVMAVLEPLKVTVTSWPEGETEMMEGAVHPKRPELGKRQVPFSRSILIEKSDFDAKAPTDFFRFKGVGSKVRLRFGYVLVCEEVIKDADENVVELKCSHVPGTAMGGKMPDNEKVKGIVHWVSEPHSLQATVRLYDRLFSTAEPGADQPDGDFLRDINPASLTELAGARLEPAAAVYGVGDRVQFERMGYFAFDPDSTEDRPVFNRIVTLRDNWAAKGAK